MIRQIETPFISRGDEMKDPKGATLGSFILGETSHIRGRAYRWGRTLLPGFLWRGSA